MAAGRSHYFSIIVAILLALFVFVEFASAQITFNRHWRRGNYPVQDKADSIESGEIILNHAARSELPPIAIARFPKNPTSIILSGNILGKIWKGSKNFPSGTVRSEISNSR